MSQKNRWKQIGVGTIFTQISQETASNTLNDIFGVHFLQETLFECFYF